MVGWGGGSEVWGRGRWEGVKCREGGSDVWEGGIDGTPNAPKGLVNCDFMCKIN